MKTKSENTRL